MLSDLISKRWVSSLYSHKIFQFDLIVCNSLPESQQELDNAISHAWTVLSALPKEPAKDLRNVRPNLLYGFITNLARHMEGMPDEGGLIQAIRPAQETFRLTIRKTVPVFWPFKEKHAEGRTFGNPLFLRDKEGEGNDMENDGGELGNQGKVIYIDEVLNRAHK